VPSAMAVPWLMPFSIAEANRRRSNWGLPPIADAVQPPAKASAKPPLAAPAADAVQPPAKPSAKPPLAAPAADAVQPPAKASAKPPLAAPAASAKPPLSRRAKAIAASAAANARSLAAAAAAGVPVLTLAERAAALKASRDAYAAQVAKVAAAKPAAKARPLLPPPPPPAAVPPPAAAAGEVFWIPLVKSTTKTPFPAYINVGQIDYRTGKDIENVPYTLRPDAALRGVWENSATPKAGWLSTLDGRLQNQMVRLKSNGQAYVSDIQRLHLTTLPRHRGRGLATFGRSSKHTGDSSARPLLPPPPPPAAAAGGGSGSRDVWHGGGPTAPSRLRTPARSRCRRGAGPAVKKPSSPKPAAEKSKTTKSTAPSRLRTPARSRSRRGARPAVMFLY